MKIASHVLLFSQDKWILKNIENAAPFVDKIYIAYSKEPWLYNKEARKQFKNQTDLKLLEKSVWFHKLVIIEGIWETEESQRNACLNAAIEDGMDYLLIHDADEFYTNEGFSKIIETIKKNPDYDYYRTPWITFWKDFQHIIIKSDGKYICGYPEIAVNLKRGSKFFRCRRLNGESTYIMDVNCYHASYVLSNDQCWGKINTWGHAHQFNKEKWYKEKWLKWDENTTNLHPITPSDWHKAIKYNKELPEILK